MFMLYAIANFDLSEGKLQVLLLWTRDLIPRSNLNPDGIKIPGSFGSSFCLLLVGQGATTYPQNQSS